MHATLPIEAVMPVLKLLPLIIIVVPPVSTPKTGLIKMMLGAATRVEVVLVEEVKGTESLQPNRQPRRIRIRGSDMNELSDIPNEM